MFHQSTVLSILLTSICLLAFFLAWRARERDITTFLSKAKLYLVEITAMIGFIAIVILGLLHELQMFGVVK